MARVVRRRQYRPSIFRREPVVVALVCMLLSGCGQAGSEMQSPAIDTAVAGDSGANTTRLDALRARRSEDEFSDKLAIGPGDVLAVTVPGAPELDKFKVRVSEDNTISLPLAGVVPVGGMTEEELREALHQRLEKPIRNPQVEVFVSQYVSREVAVVGMVQKPGLYSITSRSDNVLDMIDRAGGMTAEASSRLLFIPVPSDKQRLALARSLAASGEKAAGKIEPVRAESEGSAPQAPEKPDRVSPTQLGSASLSAASTGQSGLPPLIGTIDPIDIDLTSAARESELNVPVRPGDTIIVPAAGEVMVDGWVQNPGAFRIVPGMTAFSAVSAAGGALFSQTAEVLRTDSNGGRRSIPVDLAKVKARSEADVPVQAGDVVFVERSPIGAVPYALYQLFSKFGTGMYLPAL